MGCFRSLQYIVAVLLVCALGLAATAASVDYWWVVSYKGTNVLKTGLWRYCLIICAKRKDLFQFNENLDMDIMLTAMCAAGLSYAVSLFLTIITICQRYPSKCMLLMETILTFLGGGCCVFTIIWGMFQVSANSLGWAFYLLYGAAGLGVTAFLCSLVLLCMRAPGAYITTRRDDEIVMLSSR